MLASSRGVAMRCPKCLLENTATASFCEECAAPLGRACVNCGSQASPTARFCAQCGHSLQPVAANIRFASLMSYTPQRLADKILTSRAMLEGERKQVSVLFADIKDSMELLTARDARLSSAPLGMICKWTIRSWVRLHLASRMEQIARA